MNSELIKTFITLSELQSCTKTAQKLLVSQSTVSKRIDDLEKEIGTALVVRNKKCIKLTTNGTVFLKFAQEMLQLEQRAKDAVLIEGLPCDCISVGCVTSLFVGRICDCLISFQKKYPDVSLHIYNGGSNQMLNLLYDNKIDVCISFFPFRENNYYCRQLSDEEVVLVTGPGNHAYPGGISLEELRRLPLIRDELTYLADPQWFEYIYSGEGKTVDYVETGSMSIPFLTNGIGYGFALKSQVEKLADAGLLTVIDIPEHEKLMIKCYMIHRNLSTEYQKMFIQYIADK